MHEILSSGRIGCGFMNLFPLYFISAVALMQTAFGQEAPHPIPRNYQLSVDVDLVVFNVTVTDSKGRSVMGLPKENFRIIETGQEQTIQFVRSEDIPATLGLVIDNSGSMRRKRQEVIDAAMAFAQASNPQDEIFIVNFNERIFMGLPRGQEFTSDLNQLGAALANTRAEGKTALYDGVTAALKHIELGTHQRKALVVISDGGDNASGETEKNVLALAEQSNATIYTIDINDPDDKDHNPKVLQELATLSGGETYRPKNLEELPGIWRKIAGGIRNQYTLGYVSKNRTHDGLFRPVKVQATGKDGKALRVRARKGYMAPGNK
jgi:Ca-activated chloride channel family protein